ncbi:4-phosphopantetheinyl transferase [Thiocystis violacea]|nr:4-phosphopantetheinyl transferase [Thiocystis violacea]
MAPSLGTGDPHLWRIRTDSRGMELELALSGLGERQRARAGAMRHAAFRERYIRAQAGLRLILSRYLGGTPATLRFEYGPAGKPYLDNPGGSVFFNLTTTGDLALVGLCAGIGPESELGVDCEWIRPRVDILAVARRMFAPEVAQALEKTAEPERLAYFHRAWTALEADAKCDGRGLFRPRLPGATPPEVRHCIPEPGYIAAVARARLPPPSDWLTYDLDWI